MFENNISPIQKDALKEIIHIGANNASTALSQLVNKSIVTSLPEFNICRIKQVPKILDNMEKLMTALVLQMEDGLSGRILLLFPPEDALVLAAILTQTEQNNIQGLDEMSKSALLEVGNVLVGGCLSALSNFLGINILLSLPEVVNDTVGSLLNKTLSEIGQGAEEILEFKVNFKVEDEKISGQMIFIFEPGEIEKILEVVEVKMQ